MFDLEIATNSQPNSCPTLTCTGVTVCPAIPKRADNWHRVSGRFYCNRGALALLVDQGTTRGKVKQPRENNVLRDGSVHRLTDRDWA